MRLSLDGPAGALEALLDEPVYPPGSESADRAPRAAVVFAHPHPQQGGTMHTKAVFQGAKGLTRIGCAVLRFNFRGVGRSQGTFSRGEGELSDAASALDWLQTYNPNSRGCWIAGFSFGAWISMQLLMRRPEITGFISVAPPASLHDFSFLAPCPASGLIVHGDKDDLVPQSAVDKLAQKLQKQKNIKVEYRVIQGSDHFFQDHIDDLNKYVNNYLDKVTAQAA